jgi:hypothetical protein
MADTLISSLWLSSLEISENFSPPQRTRKDDNDGERRKKKGVRPLMRANYRQAAKAAIKDVKSVSTSPARNYSSTPRARGFVCDGNARVCGADLW